MSDQILIAPTHFETDDDAETYIARCENAFALQVRAVAEQILSLKECKLLGLGGPTCAGKSTTARLLIRNLEAAGKHIHIISIDDFFREQPKSELHLDHCMPQSIDFDSISALDFPLFCRCVEELMHHGESEMPIYDLSCGERSGTRKYTRKDENDLFLFEGIQTVYPDISALLTEYPYFSMFIRVEKSLMAGNTLFSPNRIRLLRRLVRDYYRRSAEPEFTLLLWKGVRENEEKSIFPNIRSCDTMLDSTMGYELSMLRPYLERILPPLLTSNEYGDIAAAILHDIKSVPPLSPALLPEVALYREFV